jgi:hypothetical protein
MNRPYEIDFLAGKTCFMEGTRWRAFFVFMRGLSKMADKTPKTLEMFTNLWYNIGYVTGCHPCARERNEPI